MNLNTLLSLDDLYNEIQLQLLVVKTYKEREIRETLVDTPQVYPKTRPISKKASISIFIISHALQHRNLSTSTFKVKHDSWAFLTAINTSKCPQKLEMFQYISEITFTSTAKPLSLSHTLTHTYTHTVWHMWFTRTLHGCNGSYTVQTACAIALHLNLVLFYKPEF